jgi:tRNA threonylcarbamoyl adenosine modification protein YjeE
MIKTLKTYPLLSQEDTKTLATELAKITQKGDIFLLEGDLGAGKTTFARFFIRSFLGDDIEIPSPTFTLVQTYITPQFLIWHFDLYRIEDEDDLRELGLEEALYSGISLIEWPERLGSHKPARCITFKFEMKEDTRQVTLETFGYWEARFDSLL